MKVFSTSPPSIIQPIFRTNTWHRKPIELMDNISRWRAVAADMSSTHFLDKLSTC